MDLNTLEKAELHVHLEGSVRPETLRDLSPLLTMEEILARYRYEDFMGFLMSFKWVNQHLREPEHFALVTRRLLQELEAQGVVQAEINVSAGVLLMRKLPVREIFAAIAAEAARSRLRVRFIFDAVRQFGLDHVWATAQEAVLLKDQGVIGFGIGGDELNGPAREFREVFQYAVQNGLRLAPHAGETDGPDSVWAALECGAERIGHGFRSIEDPLLVKHLRDHAIPLEICLTSNVCTGAVRSLREHPFRRLFDAGVPLVLNSDDPAMFHTTLVREYQIAMQEFGLGAPEIRQLAANSLRYAFDRPLASQTL
ncbi:MAG: adenosine deaminase [Acidobacteria bacterium]|nr:adenosine deaminase [Acidobacteriota bacterium]